MWGDFIYQDEKIYKFLTHYQATSGITITESPETEKRKYQGNRSKHNIWGLFHIPKCEGVVGGFSRRKIYCNVKDIYIHPKTNNLCRNVYLFSYQLATVHVPPRYNTYYMILWHCSLYVRGIDIGHCAKNQYSQYCC